MTTKASPAGTCAAWPWRAGLLALGLLMTSASVADTWPRLYDSFAGNINFIGTQRTLRVGATDNCRSTDVIHTPTTATLSGLPAGATIEAAYLYWVGTGTPDYTVTFDGTSYTAPADRQYTSTTNTYLASGFSGAVDVTAAVALRRNGTYTFSDLTLDLNNCTMALAAGWAMVVIYSAPTEDFRVINVFEGFQVFEYSSVTLNPNNFVIPTSPINGKIAHITWEGELGHSGSENLQFNGNILSDAVNPVGNQFNSRSTINGDNASYGVDFDVYNINAYLTPGMSSAPSVYSSGVDVVLLSAEIISVTNVPVADLGVELTRGGELTRGANATYTIDVTNSGPMFETGPVVVTTTLSSQLSFVSATGSGWSCSNAGLTVTCTRAGALGAGAAAAPITLIANVSATASGIVTVSSTVDGSLFDNVAANNTASDTFAFLPTAYAYYNLDESTWTGGILDASGNGRNATVLGSATPDPYPLPVPPDAAISGSYGTCGAGRVPSTSGTQGIDTGIDVNAIGNSGTISFWYYASAAWNDGSNRMLFDASADFGNGNADKHFFLAKSGAGRLVFAVEDSNDREATATSPAYTFAAGQWHHITVTWDLPNRVVRIYLDGNATPVATGSSGALAATLGNMNTLWFGDQRASNIAGTPTGYTSNSSNGYLDEIRIISGAVAGSDVPALASAAHSCDPAPVLDHFNIDVGGGSASTCAPRTVTISARDDSDNVVSSYTGTVTITTSRAHGDWSAATTGDVPQGTLNNGTADDGAATYVFAPGDSGALDLLLTNHHADVLRVTVNDSSVGVSTQSGTVAFHDNAFVVTPTTCTGATCTASPATASTEVVAGRNHNFSIAMYRRDPVDGNCAVATGYTGNKNLKLWRALDAANPGGAGTPLASNGTDTPTLATTAPGSNNLTLNFASGVSAFTLITSDVGKYAVSVTDDSSGFSADDSGLPIAIIGSSETLTVRPFALAITAVDNPGGTASTGSTYVAAGDTFSASVRAVAWQGADDDDGNGTTGEATDNDGIPRSAANLADNALTAHYAWATTLGRNGSTGYTPTVAVGALGGTTGLVASDFQDGAGVAVGSATAAGLTYSEVGSVTLTAAASGYLGTAGVGVTGYSGVVGRFYPHHFTADSVTVTPATSFTTGGTTYSFTYMGQDFRVQYTLHAKNADGEDTTNYNADYDPATHAPTANNYAFRVDPVLVGENGNDGIELASGVRLAASSPTTWLSGAYVYDKSNFQVIRAASSDGPFDTLAVGVKVTGAEGDAVVDDLDMLATDNTACAVVTPTPTCDAHTLFTTRVRYGRLAFQNANGSELLDLNLPMRAEYYSAAHEAFVLNSLDFGSSGSSGITLTLTDASAGDGLNVDTETCVLDDGTAGLSGEGCVTGTPAPALTRYQEPPSTAGGSFNLWLRAPGAGNSGTAIVTATTLPAWLTFDWDGDNDIDAADNPSGRAVFGVYKGSQRHIYLRELVN